MNDVRYSRWRTTVSTIYWALDRQWYGLLGRLYLHDVARASGDVETARLIAALWYASEIDMSRFSGRGRD